MVAVTFGKIKLVFPQELDDNNCMMNEQDKMLNKFDFDKMWELRNALVIGKSHIDQQIRIKGWQWLESDRDQIDNAINTLDELNEFLCIRSMIKYQDPDIGNNTPHLKTVSWE